MAKKKTRLEKSDFRFDEPEAWVLASLAEHGLKKEDILAGTLCDLKSNGHYGHTYAALLEKEMVFVGKDDAFARYALDEFTEWKAESFVSTGQLVGKKGGDGIVLAAYTNSCSAKMGHMANMANKQKKGEDISQDGKLHEEERFCPECGTPYPDLNRKVCPKCTNKRSLFMRVMSYMPKYKWYIFGIVFFMMLVTVANVVKPYVSGTLLYDEVLTKGGKYYKMILPMVLVIMGIDLFKLIASVMQQRTGAKVAAKIVYDIKVELFAAMQKLSMSFYNSKQTGSLMTRINSDALDIQYFLNEGMPFILINLVMLVSMAIVMSCFDPFLTLLVFLPVPVMVFIIKKVVPRFYKLRWKSFAKNSKLNSVINDTLSGMRVVKAFGKEADEISRFEKANHQLYEATYAAGKNGATVFPIMWWIMNLGTLFVWGVGGWKVFNNVEGMTFGVLMTFVNYIGFIYGPLNYLINCFDWWAGCMNAAQRIFEIIDRKSDVKEAKKPVRMPEIKGDISLNNVVFAYEPNKPVLHSVNLDIKAGEMIGLVGHSGAGKSTITNLITRLYDVNEGSITIDGVDIKKISLEDLRSQIGMVLQETFLFSGSVAENISYAKPDATMDEIITAAKLANAHDFIMKMPDGYETVLGRRGVNMSGGEKQRISIARAILVNPKILILDEATASVDTETERQIQEALERLTQGRTTIAIAHRLSTLRNANRLVVVERGKIAEVGTHEELEAKEGIYYKMLQKQKEALRIRGLDDIEKKVKA